MLQPFEIEQAAYWQMIPDGRLQVVLRNGEIHYFEGEEIPFLVKMLRAVGVQTAEG